MTADVSYAEVPAVAVSTGSRLFAEFIASQAASDLGIPTPVVRWFRHAAAPQGWGWEAWQDDRRLAGEARAWRVGEVWVMAGLSRRELAAVLAHEVHHDAMHRRFGPGDYSAPEINALEVGAEAYASAFVKQWRF